MAPDFLLLSAHFSEGIQSSFLRFSFFLNNLRLLIRFNSTYMKTNTT